MARTEGCDVIHSRHHDRHAIVDRLREGNSPSLPRQTGGYRAALRRFSSFGGGVGDPIRHAKKPTDRITSTTVLRRRALKPLSALARQPARLACRHPLLLTTIVASHSKRPPTIVTPSMISLSVRFRTADTSVLFRRRSAARVRTKQQRRSHAFERFCSREP